MIDGDSSRCVLVKGYAQQLQMEMGPGAGGGGNLLRGKTEELVSGLSARSFFRSGSKRRV